MTFVVAAMILSVISVVLQVRNYREDRDDARSRLICMRVGCGHTFLDHQPECKHCLCQETSYRWVDEDLPT